LVINLANTLEYPAVEMSILFYRRPDYFNLPSGPIHATECARYVERAKSSNSELFKEGNILMFIESERTIPNGLSFEEALNNKALPVHFT
jgi:hypothetical protein